MDFKDIKDVKDIDRELALTNERIKKLEQTKEKMLDGYTEEGQKVVQELLAKGYPLKQKENRIQYIIEGRKNLLLGQIRTFGEFNDITKLSALLDVLGMVLEKVNYDQTDVNVYIEDYSVQFNLYCVDSYGRYITVTDTNKLQVKIANYNYVYAKGTITKFDNDVTLETHNESGDFIEFTLSKSIETTLEDFDKDVALAIREIKKIELDTKGVLLTFTQNWDKISQFFLFKKVYSDWFLWYNITIIWFL